MDANNWEDGLLGEKGHEARSLSCVPVEGGILRNLKQGSILGKGRSATKINVDWRVSR